MMIETFNLTANNPEPTFAFAPADLPQTLTEKYRPRMLTEIRGQGCVVERLQTFLDAPYSYIFIFEGDTGTGKTSTAKALAAELGCVDMLGGGIVVIESGEQNAETVEQALRDFRHTPMFGSGWKVLIVEEADYGSVKSSNLWMTALENLPQRRLVIFTTNHVDKFPQRFIDRCEVLTFESDAAMILQDVQAAIDDVWFRETGRPESSAPRVSDLPGLVVNGRTSIRRGLRLVEPMIAAVKAGKPIPYPKRDATMPKPKAKVASVKTAKSKLAKPIAPATRPAKAQSKTSPKPVEPPQVVTGEIDWTDVIKQYNAGVSFAELGRLTGIPASTVHGRLKKLGVEFNRKAKS